MPELAESFLNQAKMHIQAGNIAKAVQLLERARVVGATKPEVMQETLSLLAENYPLVDQADKAAGVVQQIESMSPRLQQHAIAHDKAGDGYRWRRHLRRFTIAAGLLIVLAGSIFAGLHLMGPDNGGNGGSGEDTGGGPGEPTPDPDQGTPEWLSDSVGMVVIYDVYRLTFPDAVTVSWQIPLSTGSCFSVTADGYILTNRHVALGYYPEKRRVEHRPPNGPVTVPGTSVRAQYVATHMVACFGPKLADHFPCEVIYFDNTKERSRDIAILKCDKTFKNPILMAGAPKSGQAVRLSGFPGIVSHAYSKLEEEMRKMGARFKSGVREDLSYILFYSDNALASPSTTKGTISAIRGSDLETDARILKGNSGGPMLNADWKAVGIATWGIGNSGVNFAIRIDTLREEIESRIRKNRNR